MLDEYSIEVNRALEKEEELKRRINYYIRCKDEYFQLRNDLVTTMNWKELLEAGLYYEAMSSYHIHNKTTLLEAKSFIDNYKK